MGDHVSSRLLQCIVSFMAEDHDGNDCTASTTWRWETRKIRAAPQAEGVTPSEASPLRGLLTWPRRRPMTLTIKWRGGPEAWYEIRARGRTIRRPGHVALHDLMSDLARWGRYD